MPLHQPNSGFENVSPQRTEPIPCRPDRNTAPKAGRRHPGDFMSVSGNVMSAWLNHHSMNMPKQ